MSARTVPDGSPPPSDPPTQPGGPSGPGGPTGPGRQQDDYLTVNEVAELLHCDRQTVYRAIYDGDLAWHDMRKRGARRARIRIARQAAHRYMTGREHPVRAA